MEQREGPAKGLLPLGNHPNVEMADRVTEVRLGQAALSVFCLSVTISLGERKCEARR